MTYEPLHHKYRPQSFADLVGQEAIATTLTNAIRTRRIAPAYLFTGPRGTGKTSSARILAKSLNCLSSDAPTENPCGRCGACRGIASGSALDAIEIDAASNTGVENIREIIERAQFAPVQCRYKVYTIDEAHMLSSAAFNALLKTLEEPPLHVVFVLATTEPQKVLPTIISRCQRFDFRRIPLEAMVKHLTEIAAQENIKITDDAVTLVAQVAQGGLRDAESLLDQLSLLAGEITVEKVWDLVGSVPEQDLIRLLQAIASDKPEAVIDRARHLMERGREPSIVLQNLAGFYRDLLIAKTAPNRSDLVERTKTTWNQLCEQAKNWDAETIFHGQKHLKDSEVLLKNTTQPRLWLEVTLLGLLPSARKLQPQPHREEREQGSRGAGEQGSSNKTSLPPQSTPSAGFSEKLVTHQQDSPPSPPMPSGKPESPNPKPDSSSPPSAKPVTHQEDEVSQPVAEVDANLADLNQIWEQAIEHIQPFSTRTLLRQHCKLLAFEDRHARIGISSEPLLKLAHSKLSNIEAAFGAVYKHKVKVSLQVSDPKSFKTATAQGPIASSPNATSGYALPNDATSPRNLSPNSQPNKSISASTVESTAGSPAQPKAPQFAESEADEVDSAARSLAEFFEGEIVEMVSELDIRSPGKTHKQETIDATEYLEPDLSEEEDSEEDIDF